MQLWLVLLAALGGYLIGSLSFARIMMRLAAPGREYRKIHRKVEGSEAAFEGHSVSANSVREQLGSRYGCLTALLDASKAALPALVLRLLFPGEPYYLLAATTAMVGHIYPLYHGFKGGMGLSTMYGGFFVLDWLGVIVTTLIGAVTGILVDQVLVFRWSGMLIMIPWIWFRTRDPLTLIYVVVANALYWTAMIPELRQYFAFKSEGTLPDQAEIADLLGMRSVWVAVSKYSLSSLLRRIRPRSGERRDE